MTRILYYVPMVHTAKELGEIVAQLQKQVFSKERAATFSKKVDEYWEQLEQRLRLNTYLLQPEMAEKLHICVDGLPNGREDLVEKTVEAFVTEGRKSAYRIIGELKAAGAKVHGTESKEWLVKEVQYWKDIAADKRTSDPEFERELLENRDKAIIARINEVVPDGESAFVLLGLAHKVIEPLSRPPYNFEVIELGIIDI